MLVRLALLLPAASGQRLVGLLPSAEVAWFPLDPAAFFEHPEREPADLAVVAAEDLPEPLDEGLAPLSTLPEAPELVVLDPHQDPARVAELQAHGCFAILRPTLPDPDLRRALAALVARRQRILLRRVRAEQAPPPSRFDDLGGSGSESTRHLLRLAGRVASSDSSLLLLGETGAGKEWLARAIHAAGPRAGGPFVAVNCGAVPEGLLESELFGHERGAFTGAVRSRRGHFELAHRGTLFLDEVAEIAPHLQVRLLRALQERTIQRLGSETPLEVDVRIIAATNRDLVAAMGAGTFRQDLYYRLAVVTLTVPPLRDRREDVPDLLDLYLERFVKKLNRLDVRGITPEARQALVAYPWPGNIRELMNVVERAVLLTEGPSIGLADLPEEIALGHPREARTESVPEAGLLGGVEARIDRPLDELRSEVVDELERRYLQALLERNRGRIGKTAREAGMDPRTLYGKMRDLGLRKETFKRED